MERQSVDSEMIKSMGYDPDTSTLEIEFNNDAIWQYYDFPESLWFGFENAGSKGRFFNQEIRNQYRESRIG